MNQRSQIPRILQNRASEAETQIVVAAAGAGGTAVGDPTVVFSGGKRAATGLPVRAAGRAGWIVTGADTVVSAGIPIPTPFPDVAAHIVTAYPIGGLGPDRMSVSA